MNIKTYHNQYIIGLIVLFFTFYACNDKESESRYNIIYKKITHARLNRIYEKEEKEMLEKDNRILDSLYGYFSKKGLFKFVDLSRLHEKTVCSFFDGPFNASLTEKNDTLTYSFTLSNLEGYKYYGKYFKIKDSLKFFLTNREDHLDRESQADYVFTFKIEKRQFKYKNIIIQNERGGSFSKKNYWLWDSIPSARVYTISMAAGDESRPENLKRNKSIRNSNNAY